MSRDFFLENSGSHTQSSNQQHQSITVTPVQFFFFDDQKKSIKIDTTDFWAPKWRIWACFDFSQEGFKKSQLARKLKTSFRKNVLEACSTSTWLTNKPYDNPPNRRDQFFWCDWKKFDFLKFSKKWKKTLISTLVDLLSIFTNF